MKRILYIGSGAPWLGGAGYLVRQRMFLRALAGAGRLHLALFDLPADAPGPPFECEVTRLELLGRRGGGRIANALADFVNPLPRMVRDIDVKAARRPLASLNVGRFDAVFGYRIDFSHAAGVLGHKRLLLDVDDPEHVRWRRRAESGGGVMDWRTERDLEKLRRFEVDAVGGAAQAFVCQSHDRALFPSENVTVVPNGVEVPGAPSVRATPPVILFLGNFAAGSGSPNVDALEWFTQSVWPFIHARYPMAECRIVGRIDAAMRERLSLLPNVRVVGFVASLAEAFANARLSVAPLRFGTGTRIKILDSFAHGCPVVSTTVGAEGLEVTANSNILLGDGAEAFAEHCVRLLTDEALAQRLGMSAYELVAGRYDARGIETTLREFFKNYLQ